MQFQIRPIAVALLALGLGAPVQAANPKITLSLQNVTASEAVRKLAEAAGVSVSLHDAARAGAGRNGAPETASFQWKDVTFANALRELARQFMLQPNRSGSGYTLYRSFQAPPGPPAKRVGLVEKGGVRLYARSVGMSDYRRKDFINGNDSGGGNMTLDLMAELGDGDAETIAGIANVRARDDQGNLLGNPNAQPFYGGYSGGVYPDEWTGSVNIPAPHPRAKKLAWLEGDLMGYRSVKTFKVEIPLPITEKYVRKDAGDVILVVSRYQATREAGDDDVIEGLPAQPGGARADGARMRIRVYTPQGQARVGPRQGGGTWNIQPVLVGASGNTYTASRTHSTGWGDGQYSVNDSTYSFGNGTDTPVKLVWELAERSQPVKLFSFRMTDIPLPDITLPAPPRPGVQPVVPAGPQQDHPFYEKGGATLVSPVLLEDKAPVQGTVQLGLSARVGTGWGPVRWLDLDIEEGAAKLEGLKPGTYRLHRKFRPADGEAAPRGGAWANTEVVITAVAGKELKAAPLRWSSRPLVVPGKPAVKAPAKPPVVKKPGG